MPWLLKLLLFAAVVAVSTDDARAMASGRPILPAAPDGEKIDRVLASGGGPAASPQSR